MARLKNTGDPVHVYAPEGDQRSLLVDTDQIVEVPGEVTEELDDAYIVGHGDDARAWPKSRWAATSKADHHPTPDRTSDHTDGN